MHNFETVHLFSSGGMIKILIHSSENLCNNALDLSNRELVVENDWPFGMECQWLISAVDDQHYVNLEFENLDVKTR